MITETQVRPALAHKELELPRETLLRMYYKMLLARKLDERMWILHRQGEVAFHMSGIGQEAAQVGMAFALKPATTGCIPTTVTLRWC